ncbi:unnamed protein product, partial [Staurois parvus]
MDRLGSVRCSQAGQVSNVRAVRYRRSRQRIVRVTSWVQQKDGQQRSGSKQGQQLGRNTGYQVQGLMGNIHQGT